MAGEVQSGVTGENHRLLSRIYLHTSLSIYCNINRSRTTHANKKQRQKCKNAGEVPRGAIKSYREFLFYTTYILVQSGKVSSRNIYYSGRYRARAVSSIYYSIPGGGPPQYAGFHIYSVLTTPPLPTPLSHSWNPMAYPLSTG